VFAAIELSRSNCGLEGYVSVPIEGLQRLEELRINLYRCRKQGADLLLINDAKWKVDEEQLVELKVCGDLCLFIAKQDLPTVSQKLSEGLADLVSEATIPVESRFALLQLAYATQLERAFHKSRLKNLVPLAQEISQHMVTLADQEKLSVSRLYHRLHHNSQQYTHLTNVAAYGLALAQTLGTFSSQELQKIVVGCLLHEVGKLYLPSQLLSKEGRFTTQDTQQLESVPQLAYEALVDFVDLDFGQLMMAYQQHERVDGTGYPVHTLCEDIHPWAKLLAVADELAAMTCDRPYRGAVSLKEGLAHISKLANLKLDANMVQCLITNSQSQ